MPKLTFEAKRENLDNVLNFINTELSKTECVEELKLKIDLVVEEIFINIVNYAYDSLGKVDINCDLDFEASQVEIRFTDSGKPYNPLEHLEPDISLSAEQRSIGGLGILISKKLMDDIQYQYQNGKNILTIKKYIKRGKI